MTNQKSSRQLTAIIPAAGRGSRLGLSIPKVFVPLSDEDTIWDVIYAKVSLLADRVILVLSPEGVEYARGARAELFHANEHLKIVVQPQPLGMGDAIFGAWSELAYADDLLIIWGDQCNLSAETLQACLDLHHEHRTPGFTLPVVRMNQPYVEYIFDNQGLVAIHQSREGERCQPGGWSDLGVFLLSGGSVLNKAWNRYHERDQAGSQTGEINFLPFLTYLSTRENWTVLRYEDAHPSEALGINTQAELEQARKLHRESKADRKARS